MLHACIPLSSTMKQLQNNEIVTLRDQNTSLPAQPRQQEHPGSVFCPQRARRGVSAWCQTVQPCLSLTLSAVPPMSPNPLGPSSSKPFGPSHRNPSASSRQTTDGLAEDGETGYASFLHFPPTVTSHPSPTPTWCHITLYFKSSFHLFICMISFFLQLSCIVSFLYTCFIQSIHVSIHLPP